MSAHVELRTSHNALIKELAHAHDIILAMLNAMTFEQKAAVAERLATAGISTCGMTRANEREAVLIASAKASEKEGK